MEYCWPMLFARAGFNATLFDIHPDQIKAALTSIEEQLEGLKVFLTSYFSISSDGY